jgi:formyltetrahydrofolate deformylase
MLISCQDAQGLVHKVTGVLYESGLNVTQNQEFVDHSSKRFFMRTEFDGVSKDKDLPSSLRDKIIKCLPKNSFCSITRKTAPKLVVFASKELHCLGDILLKHHTQELQAEILAVISQHSDAADLVKRLDLPFHCVEVTGNKPQHRAEHEQKILKILSKYKPDYLVLARYMRILSQDFIKTYPERILNIHHSFLPAFIGKNPYEQAYQRGVKIIGATAHFVTEKLDEGPIIYQDVISVDHSCTINEMAKLGQDVEKIVLSRALNLVIDNKVLVDGNRTVVF